MSRIALAVLFALVVLAIPRFALAHQSSFTYGSIEMREGGRRADFELRMSTADLFEALGLESDRDASDREIRDGARRLEDYVFARVTLRADDDACAFKRRGVYVVRQGERFAQVRGELSCPRVISELFLSYNLFFDLDPRHEGLVTVGKKVVQLRESAREIHYETGHGPDVSRWGFLRSGMNHVLFGLDHILFLVSLLLVVALRRTDALVEKRAPVATLRRTLAIVTAFTIGHSLTLILAALGWVELPSALVESLIAASIVYVAIENLVRVDPPRRYLVTFAFGLMHGLGFARMLRPLLAPEDTVVPLLVFNVGVELGQLVVLIVVLPVLYASIIGIGAEGYRRRLLPVGCTALAALGALWFCERAFGLELVGL